MHDNENVPSALRLEATSTPAYRATSDDMGSVSPLQVLSQVGSLVSEKSRLASDASEQLRQQTYKLQQIIDGMRDSLVVLDGAGKIEQFNMAWRKLAAENGNPGIHGCDIGDSYLEFCLSKCESTYRGVSASLGTAQPFEFEYVFAGPLESRRYLLRGTPLPAGGAVLLHIDITDRYREAISQRMTEAVFENANDVILICRPGGELIMANPQAASVFERSDLAGVQLHSLLCNDFMKVRGREAIRLLRRGESWRGEARARLSDGRLIPFWGSASVVRGEQSAESYWIVIASNIAPLKEAQALLSRQAFYDELTGLPNRRFFQENLISAISRSTRHGEGLALIYIDIDQFKLVNDTYGHDAGDAFLTQVAQRLRSHVREVDLIARMGGDEFTVILEAVKRDTDVVGVCQKLIEALKPVIKVGQYELFARCSIGISRFPEDASDEVSLLRCADLAMYKAKQSGRNRVCFYSLAMDAANRQRAEIERGMNLGLATGGFYTVFQPIVCINSNRLVAVEALMRWRCPDGSMIGPDVFIPIAEESGLIHALGESILRDAVRLVRRWEKQSIESIRVNVNVSSVQLQKKFSAVLARVIEEERITPWRISVEITESAIMENFDACVAELHKIRSLGVSVALDDFGTGYSSLSYLRNLPISALKMDRSFVRDVHENNRDQAIFRAVLTMASELGIDVVAEGVEHYQHVSVLSGLGCRLMQGYFFSPALPVGGAPDGNIKAEWADQMTKAMKHEYWDD